MRSGLESKLQKLHQPMPSTHQRCWGPLTTSTHSGYPASTEIEVLQTLCEIRIRRHGRLIAISTLQPRRMRINIIYCEETVRCAVVGIWLGATCLRATTPKCANPGIVTDHDRSGEDDPGTAIPVYQG